ncbi:hypothetical protein ACLB2K_024539 [Fragaria x ananassa]
MGASHFTLFGRRYINQTTRMRQSHSRSKSKLKRNQSYLLIGCSNNTTVKATKTTATFSSGQSTSSANSLEIKKAYYKLSLKHHPDKNPDPESKKLFVKIANAYEILKDEASQEQYDYAIAHPEEYFYNTARYYQYILGLKISYLGQGAYHDTGLWDAPLEGKKSPYRKEVRQGD